jgi:sigma-E factor negative regulatory protein RseA
MDVNLSSDFAARMAARLDMEPTIIAPAVAEMPLSDRSDSDTKRTSEGAEVRASGMTTSQRPFRRWAKPGMIAAAAVASVAFFTTPQLMVALKGEPAGASTPAIVSVGGSASSPETVQTGAQSAVVSSAPEGVVLRDPRIDEYLLAHQRFSPSVYSTAQYARSATFANDSNK